MASKGMTANDFARASFLEPLRRTFVGLELRHDCYLDLSRKDSRIITRVGGRFPGQRLEWLERICAEQISIVGHDQIQPADRLEMLSVLRHEHEAVLDRRRGNQGIEGSQAT